MSKWNANIVGDLRAALLQKLLKGYDPNTRSSINNTTDLLIVERVEGSIYGNAILHLTSGYRLVLFLTSRFAEAWRFFAANSDESHFVVGDEDDPNRGFDPVTAQDYLERARHLERAKEYDRALADYNEAIRLEPENSDAYYKRGCYYDLSIEDYDKAIADYTEAIRLDPTNVKVYFSRALEYRFNAKYSNRDAMAEYNAIITVQPDNADAYEERGYLYHQVGNDEAALSDYNTAIHLEPSIDGYLKRARLRAHLGDYVGALADCDEALFLDPKSYAAHEDKGDIYDTMGDLHGTVREYKNLITLF